MDAPARQEILDLATRLARREGVDPSWIDYPTWAGSLPGTEAILAKAAHIRQWAKAILTGELQPPDWLRREDQLDALRDHEPDGDVLMNTIELRGTPPPEPTPAQKYAKTLDPAAVARAWCSAEAKRTAPKPAREDILALAFRLGQIHMYPTDWVYYPESASFDPEIWPMINLANGLKRWASAILRHEAPPTAWMIRDDPVRWAPPPAEPLPLDERGPDTLERAKRCLHLQAVPLAAAYLLRRMGVHGYIGNARPPPTRPPPLLRWLSPRRDESGPLPPIPRPERESRFPALVPLFGNGRAVEEKIHNAQFTIGNRTAPCFRFPCGRSIHSHCRIDTCGVIIVHCALCIDKKAGRTRRPADIWKKGFFTPIPLPCCRFSRN